MTLVEHDVGRVEHVHAKSNLRLETTCSVKLSSSHGTIFPFSTLFQKLDTLLSSSALVARSNELRVSLQFIMDDFHPEDLDRATFMEGLAAIFCGAEIWKQLGLKACQIFHPEGQNFPSRSRDLCFSVRHNAVNWNEANEIDEETTFRSHGLMQPPGIPSAFMEHIQLRFFFSYLRFRTNGKRYKFGFFEELGPPMLFADDHLAKRMKKTNMPWSFSNQTSLSCPNHSRRIGFLPTRNSDDGHQSKITGGARGKSISPFESFRLDSPGLIVAVKLPHEEPPTKRPASDYIERENKVILADLAKLFDAGFRTMIGGDKIRPLTGVTLVRGHSGPKLAEISPILFRPGYLSAVWEHDRFFDTIAHTTVMIYGHSRSRSLRSKIEELESFAPEEYVENDALEAQASNTSTDMLLNAVKVRLWRLTLLALLCRPGTTKLKPLDWKDACFVRDQDERKMPEQGLSDSENANDASAEKVDESLLFGQNGEASGDDSTLFGEDPFNSALGDNEDLFVGVGGTMKELGLEDEDLFWKDDYAAAPGGFRFKDNELFGDGCRRKSGLTNDEDGDERFKLGSGILFDGDEILLRDFARNSSSISLMHRQAWPEEILLGI